MERLGTFDMGDLDVDVSDSWQSKGKIQPWEGRKVICGR